MNIEKGRTRAVLARRVVDENPHVGRARASRDSLAPRPKSGRRCRRHPLARPHTRGRERLTSDVSRVEQGKDREDLRIDEVEG